MLINTFLDTEDFVHLYYPEDEPPAVQGCGAGARMASKYPPRPPSPASDYTQRGGGSSSSEMSERERRAPPAEPPPHRVRAADLYPRLRTTYDEPGLDVPFTPICAEFVQWVGRTADCGTIAMSNYRLHAQPRRRNGPGASVPLRLIDAVEIRDLLHLVVLCKNGRQLKCTFGSGEQCLEWWRRLNTGLAPAGSPQELFACAYAAWAKEQPPASVHRALLRASHAPHRHWFGPEVERLGFTAGGAWRVTAANADYKLCPSYPPLLVVPATIGDEDLDSVARFRAMRRVPAVVWRHRGNGAVIARSSQPEVGWLGWRSSEDERLLAAFVAACNADRGLQPPNTNKQLKLLIVDARSYASAVTNRARGGGCECQQYYPGADIQFMSLPNIHHVRRSFHQMRALVAEPSDQNNWHSGVERTLWLQYLSGVVRAACLVARGVLAGRPALVHCSDGWDRTPQIVAAAQLLLDPFYRTLQGFRVLVEREWLDFGHKFADRCGHQIGPEDPNERSPIFLQWLDVVHQLMLQYPCSFEFNEAYLIKMATHVHSCMFGTFLCNTGRERAEARVPDTTAHVWQLLRAPAYRNHLYSPHADQVPCSHYATYDLELGNCIETEVLWPEYSVRSMQVWWSLFGGEREEPDDDAEPDAPRNNNPPHNGLMTKTRSCDNLLNEGEKRTAQRRCSDPSLAPDVMKLSSMVGAGECRSALTDSCVDELPALARQTQAHARDQVDGLHPDHFENSSQISRDITSGSSSLERELAGATVMIDKVIDHTIENHLPEHTLHDPDDNIECSEDVRRYTSLASNVDSQRHRSDSASVSSNNVETTVRFVASPVVGTPEEPAVFVCDPYSDVIGVSEVPIETSRTRNVSITWRSISESSNQSSTGFEIGDATSRPEAAPSTPEITSSTPEITRLSSHESSPLDNHNLSEEGDLISHNLVSELTNHNRENGVTNGSVNGELSSKFLEAELNGGATSSSISSESDCEVGGVGTGRRGPRASQLTLCPASPRRLACCHCSRPSTSTSGIETSGECSRSGGGEVCWCGVCGGEVGGGAVRCVCGAGGALSVAPDPVDGLPPATDPLQARLHQIIIYQKKVVEELCGQLREAREALRRASPAPASRPAHASPSAPEPAQMSSSVSSRAGSSSGSASEVEVGEEARGVVWLPDAAAPRCQHCRNHFWLARRRHHCRRCGGIFCGSCSEMSAWGECGSVRMCRRCRALR